MCEEKQFNFSTQVFFSQKIVRKRYFHSTLSALKHNTSNVPRPKVMMKVIEIFQVVLPSF